MRYKVCIKAAGKGTRISYAKSTNKALLPLGGQAALSHLIEKFPEEVEIVIPVGHKAQLIKDFVSIAYPSRKITFVDVDRYEGKGSGPGYSLLCCKRHLQCPFVFFACDTVVMEDIPEPTKNWIGVASISDSKDYLVAEVQNQAVKKFFDKVDKDTFLHMHIDYSMILQNAFIGLAAIKDYEDFWRGLETDTTLVKGELQVANGLNALLNKKLETMPFTWFDIGTDAGYERTNRYFKKNEILTKPDEFIYFEGNKVIKYFADEERAKGRVRRARLLNGVVPEVVTHKNVLYAYKHIKGRMLSEIVDRRIFEDFLEFCKARLWIRKELKEREKRIFKAACKKFYYDKTRERIRSFYEKTGTAEREEIINGVKVPPLNIMMEKINWESLYEGIPVLFHGDPQPENVILSDEGKFYLLDWREEFAGLQEYGDIYYDLAKIYHALIISGEVIRKNQFEVKQDNSEVNYTFFLKSNLLDFKVVFEDFIKREGCDLYKIRLLTALIYLNISPLHHSPYDFLLYYLGKRMLKEVLDGRR